MRLTLMAVTGLLALGFAAPLTALAQSGAPGPDAPGQPGAASLPGQPQSRSATPGGGVPGAGTEGETDKGLWDRPNLFPDPGGVRGNLAARGLTFGLSETGEVLGNATGGTRQGAVYEGLTQFGVGLDTEKAFGLSGGIVNVSAYQVHGRGLSINDLGNNLNTVSSIEAFRGTLLFEAWYQQAFLDKKIEVRVGQLAADQEFLISQYGNLFINHTFGWSTLPSADLPSGGPAYPLGTPGVRVRWYARDDLTLLAAVFNGDPAGPGAGVPQARDASGTAFRLRDGVFVIAEVQYAVNQSEGATGLAGTYKAGAWYNTQNFADQRRNASGASIADAATMATLGRNRRGDYSLYVIGDQLVWRRAGDKDGGIGVFGRIMGAPGDRNLVNVYADGGVTWKGALPGRALDTVGLGVGFARISDTAAKLDSDIAQATGSAYPIRRSETVLELTYQAQLAPWLAVQPTAQYLFNLNGGVVNPVNPGKRLGDAAVFGIHTQVTF